MINVRTNIDTYKYKAPNVSHIYVLRAYIFMPIWSELIWFRFMSNNFPHILSLTHSLPCSFLLFCWYPRGPNNPIIIHINVVISIIHIVAHPFYCCASCSFPLSQSTHTLTLTQFSRLGFFFQFHPFKSLFSCRYFRFSFFCHTEYIHAISFGTLNNKHVCVGSACTCSFLHCFLIIIHFILTINLIFRF